MTIHTDPTLPGFEPPSVPSAPTPDREWARAHIARRRKLRADIVAYVVINAFLIAVWAMTGTGYFWPAWVLLGWGTLLALDIWNYGQHRPITDDDIDRELAARR